MRFRKPSPSMAVSIAALVMASTGSAVAAVSYASNAGAVDHKSAVSATSSRSHAAGRLVATRKHGNDKGRIPNNFLAQVPYSTTFDMAAQVNDNAAGAPQPLYRSPFGTLTASCNDQDSRAGSEDPAVAFSFSNSTGNAVNVARTGGRGNPSVVGLPAGAQYQFTTNGSSTFRLMVEAAGTDVVYDGQARQDGTGTAAGACVVAGTAQVFRKY